MNECYDVLYKVTVLRSFVPFVEGGKGLFGWVEFFYVLPNTFLIFCANILFISGASFTRRTENDNSMCVLYVSSDQK